MNLFLLTIDDDNNPDEVHAIVARHFEERFRLSTLTWVVAHKSPDPSVIAQRLGVEAEPKTGNRISGVVSLIEDFSGYASKALWRQIEKWQAS